MGPEDAITPGGSGSYADATALVSAAREFLEYMQVERGVSTNTIASYRRGLVRYLDFLKGHGIDRPDDVNQEAVMSYAAFLASRESGLSARSMSQAFSAVRMFHRFMVAEGIAATDPTGKLPSPRIPRAPAEGAYETANREAPGRARPRRRAGLQGQDDPGDALRYGDAHLRALRA